MKSMHVSVSVENNDLKKALKVFKKRCFASGHLKAVRDRQHYVKPTTRRKMIKEDAMRRQKQISNDEKLHRGILK